MGESSLDFTRSDIIFILYPMEALRGQRRDRVTQHDCYSKIYKRKKKKKRLSETLFILFYFASKLVHVTMSDDGDVRFVHCFVYFFHRPDRSDQV